MEEVKRRRQLKPEEKLQIYKERLLNPFLGKYLTFDNWQRH